MQIKKSLEIVADEEDFRFRFREVASQSDELNDGNYRALDFCCLCN